jgi:CRP-like cAMP-binding protein
LQNHKKLSHVSPKYADGKGNLVHNEILLRLPLEERETLFSRLEFVRLNAGAVLHEPGDTLKSAYFCDAGLFSMLTVFSNGKTVEGGLVGREGFIGLPLVAGFHTAATRLVVHTDATAFRVDGQALPTLLKQCSQLERRLQQFSQLLAMQVTQIVACNRMHEVTERLARWLLMSADKIDSNLPFTQEALSQVLGTRRSSITKSVADLERAGAIAPSRANVAIINRERLEKSACECYATMKRQVKEWESNVE